MKYFPIFFNFIRPYAKQLLSAYAKIFFKILIFFCPQKAEKKTPQKVAYLWQLGGFFSLQPRLPKTAQNFISVSYKFFYQTIPGRISRHDPFRIF